jgi:hypothetical protein
MKGGLCAKSVGKLGYNWHISHIFYSFLVIFVPSGAFPFRHGARPVSTEIQTHRVFTKMQFFGGNTPQTFL